jgi:hypothetical protein
MLALRPASQGRNNDTRAGVGAGVGRWGSEECEKEITLVQKILSWKDAGSVWVGAGGEDQGRMLRQRNPNEGWRTDWWGGGCWFGIGLGVVVDKRRFIEAWRECVATAKRGE